MTGLRSRAAAARETVSRAVANMIADWAVRKSNRAWPVIMQTMGAFPGSKELSPEEDLQDYSTLYQINPWTYAATCQIATAAAGIPWKLYRKKKGGHEEETGHYIADVVQRPNPRRSWARIQLATFGFLELAGLVYWALEKEESAYPNEIWYLRPDQVRVIPDEVKEVKEYVYTNGLRKPIPYEPHEIVHFDYWSPQNDLFGQGSITAARNAHITDLQATDWNKRFFTQGTSGTVVMAEKEMERPQIKRLRERILEQYRSSNKLGNVDVLWGIKNIQEIGKSQKDVEFLGLKKLSREEILAAHGVPPSMVGLLEFANYANVDQQVRIFWNNLIPKLVMVRDAINLQWVWNEESGGDTRLFLDFDLSDVKALQEDAVKKTERQKTQVLHGMKSRNEIRIENGDPPYPGGDVMLAPMSAVPTGEVVREEPETEGDEGEESTEQDEWDDFFAELEEYFASLPRQKGNRRIVAPGLDKSSGLTRYRIDEILPDEQEEADRLSPILFPLTMRAAAAGSGQVVDLVNEATPKALAGAVVKGDGSLDVSPVEILPGFDLDWDIMSDPVARELIAVEGARKAKYITENVKAQIRVDLYSGIELGESLTQLTDRVDEATIAMKRARYWALRIARTEIRQGMNYGADRAMKETGVDRKVWIASPSPDSRQLHLDTDAESQQNPVKVGQVFTPINAEYPGGTGDPGEDINCRCDTAPYVGALEGKALKDWTAIFRKAKGASVAHLEAEWISPLHGYLEGYMDRVKEVLRAA